jgi:hypothetical protein
MQTITMEPVFILFLSTIGTLLALIIINIILFFYCKKSHKKIDILLEKGKIKDFKDILFSQIDKTKEQEKNLAEAVERVKKLESMALKNIQKVGIVRFNPFSDVGGNQSFAIALLDNENNGFVISSLFIDQSSRVYTKPIRNGKSDHSLSKEEIEAISRAIA